MTHPVPSPAGSYARLALTCIQRELPNHIQHSIGGPDDVRGPRALHPAFYGCYDWHSAVHGHWMLVRLLRTHPALPEAAQIRAALDANLSAANLVALHGQPYVDYLANVGRFVPRLAGRRTTVPL